MKARPSHYAVAISIAFGVVFGIVYLAFTFLASGGATLLQWMGVW